MNLSLLTATLVSVCCAAGTLGAQTFTPPIVPANPDAAGQELAARLLSMQPAAGITNLATLTIHPDKADAVTVPLTIEVSVTDSNWTTTYVASEADATNRFTMTRDAAGQTTYSIHQARGKEQTLSGQAAMVPLAGSDFTLAELGMEFLHWPTQRLLKKEIRRTQSCDKLESIAPPGWTNSYVRVLSWFDIDTGGPVVVEAYDAQGHMVKEFRPRKFEKVNGQYQVEEIEMNDLRTRSRSSIHFELKPIPGGQ